MEDRKKTWDNLGIDAVISQPNSDPRKSHSPLTSSTKGKPCDWPLNLKITARKRGSDTGKGDPFLLWTQLSALFPEGTGGTLENTPRAKCGATERD